MEQHHIEVDKSYFVDIKANIPPSHSAQQLTNPSVVAPPPGQLPPITSFQQQGAAAILQHGSQSQPSTPTHVSHHIQQHQQQQQQITHGISNLNIGHNLAENNTSNVGEQPAVSAALPSARKAPNEPVSNVSNNQNQGGNVENNVNMERVPPHSIIVDGHATFLRAMNNRYRNLTQIKMICANNNLKVNWN